MDTLTKWKSFVKELANLYFFWFFGVVFFFIFRLVFIAIYHKKLAAATGAGEFLKTFTMGFRFDCTAVAYFLLLPFITLLVLAPMNKFRAAKNIRIVLQYLFLILSAIICAVTLNYFREYQDQFNNFLFLAIYDDRKAVMTTIIKDFHPVMNAFFLIITIVAGLLIFKFYENRTFIYRQLSRFNSKAGRIVLSVITLLLLVFCFRGSFSAVPAIRKWAGVSSDSFLNKTIVNPYRSLKYAIEDFDDLDLLNNKNPYIDEKAFNIDFPQQKVSDILRKTAGGPMIEKPKQIFLMVMESYDAWPLMEKYQPFRLSTRLSKIAANGTRFTNFLPAANATFDSFGAITTNVPYCGVNISQLGTVNKPYISSIFSQFKKLGYQVNVFYGGFLSWENIGDFCKYQGADRIFSGVDMGGVSDSGAWGIEDEKLFEMVVKNTNPNTYSLNIILTSSYHPPYTVDIYKKGFPYKSKEDLPKGMQQYYDEGMTMTELGHLWYGDKAIGDFVDTAEKKFSTGIFCFTGDHFGRRFINYSPNLYERSSVAFIMYGKNIPKSINTTPGTHIDIMPTLMEMIAPKGFEYYSFGTSLFDKSKTKALSYEKMVVPNELYYFPKEANIEKIDLTTFKETQFKTSPLDVEHKKLMALAWYYTLKGDTLHKSQKKTVIAKH